MGSDRMITGLDRPRPSSKTSLAYRSELAVRHGAYLEIYVHDRRVPEGVEVVGAVEARGAPPLDEDELGVAKGEPPALVREKWRRVWREALAEASRKG